MTYGCEEAIRDIDLFFSKVEFGKEESDKKLVRALQRAITHMTKGTAKEKHNISCDSCWEYYQQMKRKYCRG